jgi:hypothetical protein
MNHRYVRTETGSLYEFDTEGKRVRRLSGVKNPTPRQGADGVWKLNMEVAELSNGRLLIAWEAGESEDGLAIMKTTMTSAVVARGDSLDDVVAVN